LISFCLTARFDSLPHILINWFSRKILTKLNWAIVDTVVWVISGRSVSRVFMNRLRCFRSISRNACELWKTSFLALDSITLKIQTIVELQGILVAIQCCNSFVGLLLEIELLLVIESKVVGRDICSLRCLNLLWLNWLWTERWLLVVSQFRAFWIHVCWFFVWNFYKNILVWKVTWVYVNLLLPFVRYSLNTENICSSSRRNSSRFLMQLPFASFSLRPYPNRNNRSKYYFSIDAKYTNPNIFTISFFVSTHVSALITVE